MADGAPPLQDTMQQMFTAFQEEMRNMGQRMEQGLNTIGERVGRLERVPRLAPLRNVAPQPAVQEEDDIHEPEENPPDPPHAPDPPLPNQRIRDPLHRGRVREEDHLRKGTEIKIIPPTFAGKVDPEAYLDWERRMEHIFECYRYNEAKKIALAAAQLTEYAISWWDREVAERRRQHLLPIATWNDMKTYLRRRYVPPNYTREMQKRFRKLSQGHKTVEEYFEEFEHLRNRLELDDSTEALMAQFIDGLQERISRKVERQPYENLHDLLHLSIQIEQQIKKKSASTHKSRPNVPYTPVPTPTLDKGKTVDSDQNYKVKPRETRLDQGKFFNTSRTHDLQCYKCKGRGHISRECPNQRVMIITPTGDYDSQDEDEADMNEEIILYPEEGETLVILRALNTQQVHEEQAQRDNLFHTRCTIKDKVCHMIIDSGSCTNIASTLLVDKLGIETTPHPMPYKLKWLNDKEEMKVSKQAVIPFTIGHYKDQVTCDVVPMQAGHILLGRPWQYDRDVTHHGRTNHYSFCLNNQKFTLAPMDQAEVRVMQSKSREKRSSKISLFLDKTAIKYPMKSFKHLVLSKDCETGTGTNKELMELPPDGRVEPTKTATNLIHRRKQGYIYSLLIKEAPLNAPNHLKQNNFQGKLLNQHFPQETNLLSLHVGNTVLRSKPFQGRGNDEDIIQESIQAVEMYKEPNIITREYTPKDEAVKPSVKFLCQNPPWHVLMSFQRAQTSGYPRSTGQDKHIISDSLQQTEKEYSDFKARSQDNHYIENKEHVQLELRRFSGVQTTKDSVSTSLDKQKKLYFPVWPHATPNKESTLTIHFEASHLNTAKPPDNLEGLKLQ